MGFTTFIMGKGFDQPRNSINQVIDYLDKHPFSSETQIQEDVWDYYRNETIESVKKYAELVRRGLSSGKIARVEAKVKGSRSQFFYYIPR